MQVQPAAILLALVLLALGKLAKAPIIFAFFASLAFGSTAILSLPAVGGVTLLLYVPLAGLLVATAVVRRTFWIDVGRVFRLHWTPLVVIILLLYTVTGALLMPRLFAGSTTVFVPSRGAIVETALRPVSGNINQSAYFTLGVCAFFAVAGQLVRNGRLELIKIGFFAYALANVLLGILDLLGKLAGAGDILAPIRTAGYDMLVEVQVEGFWRIAGGYSEASAFGGVSVVLLAFTFSYWRSTASRPALLLSTAILILVLLCTSSSAYASLALLAPFLALSWAWRLFRNHLSNRDVTTLLAGTLTVALVLGVLAYSDALLAPVQVLIRETLINKSTSSSAVERLYWNTKSLQAFVDTHGFGIGIGSSRASSSFVAILSQLGAIGCFLILLLIADIARPIPRPGPDPVEQETAAICNGLRTAIFATMIPAAMTGSSADPGILFFISTAGILVGRARLRQMQAARIRAGGESDTSPGRIAVQSAILQQVKRAAHQ